MNIELKVVYLNALSIGNKVDELIAQFEIGRFGVVGITELRLKKDQNWELNIYEYTSYRKDWQVSRGWWGGSAGNK